jgi:hypothetical protein
MSPNTAHQAGIRSVVRVYGFLMTGAYFSLNKKINSYKKKQWRPPSIKRKKGGKNISPRNRKACHSISTAHSINSDMKSKNFLQEKAVEATKQEKERKEMK